jgi:sulfate/thiosulfate-binding protein
MSMYFIRPLRKLIISMVIICCCASITELNAAPNLEPVAKKRQKIQLLNVAYDPTRDLFKQLNKRFIEDYQNQHANKKLKINQSHGPSGKQALAVMNGLEADVVTIALEHDVDMMAKDGLLDKKWRHRFANNSSPYGSIIVFLVRAGNPKNIKDWDDLVKPGVEVMTANPKISGGARISYLAAWHHAMSKFHNNEDHAIDFMKRLYGNAPMLDVSSRASVVSFVKRNIGDVVVIWENEAMLAQKHYAKFGMEIVVPSSTLYVSLPVAVVDKYAKKHNNEELAKQYLEFMYTDGAQELIAKNHLRPLKQELFSKYQFPIVKTISLQDLGKFAELQTKHFADGGIFDGIYGK